MSLMCGAFEIAIVIAAVGLVGFFLIVIVSMAMTYTLVTLSILGGVAILWRLL